MQPDIQRYVLMVATHIPVVVTLTSAASFFWIKMTFNSKKERFVGYTAGTYHSRKQYLLLQ